jgi:hypothetical protein
MVFLKTNLGSSLQLWPKNDVLGKQVVVVVVVDDDDGGGDDDVKQLVCSSRFLSKQHLRCSVKKAGHIIAQQAFRIEAKMMFLESKWLENKFELFVARLPFPAAEDPRKRDHKSAHSSHACGGACAAL